MPATSSSRCGHGTFVARNRRAENLFFEVFCLRKVQKNKNKTLFHKALKERSSLPHHRTLLDTKYGAMQLAAARPHLVLFDCLRVPKHSFFSPLKIKQSNNVTSRHSPAALPPPEQPGHLQDQCAQLLHRHPACSTHKRQRIHADMEQPKHRRKERSLAYQQRYCKFLLCRFFFFSFFFFLFLSLFFFLFFVPPLSTSFLFFFPFNYLSENVYIEYLVTCLRGHIKVNYNETRFDVLTHYANEIIEYYKNSLLRVVAEMFVTVLSHHQFT